MEYLNFDLKISAGSDNTYTVEIIQSPGGEAQGSMEIPPVLQKQLDSVKKSILSSGGSDRAIGSITEATEDNKVVAEFVGQELFKALMVENVRDLYKDSLNRAKEAKKGLRLRLRIAAPELASLPWELLRDPKDDYLSLSSQTPVTRYLAVPTPIESLKIEPPLRVLGMVASPDDLPPLDVENEKKRMDEALADLVADGRIDFIWLEGRTYEDLQRELRREDVHVFHFVGHGDFDEDANQGLLALEKEDKTTFRLKAEDLGRLLKDESGLRLVVLNACSGAEGNVTDLFSSTASEIIRCGIPAVVAMQNKISDEAAIQFARIFYQSIADGSPVDTSMTEARKYMKTNLDTGIEWVTPVLHMRSPDGRLFEVEKEGQKEEAEELAAVVTRAAWKRPQAIIGMAAVLLVAIIAGFYFIPQFLGAAPLEVADTYEIVFDASTAMQDQLEGENISKLAAAQSAMKQEIFGFKVTSADNVALRFFRGDCSGEIAEEDKLDGLKHYFAKQNDDKVKNEITALTTGDLKHEATLTKAIILAIKELSNATIHFGDAKVKREVIVITGGTGSCIEPAEKLQQRIADLEKNVNVVNGEGATLIKNGQATSQNAMEELAVGTIALQVSNNVRDAEAGNAQLEVVKMLDNIAVRPVGIGLNGQQKTFFRALVDTVLGQKPYFADNLDEVNRALGPKAEADKFQQAKEAFLEAERLYFESQKMRVSDKVRADNLITRATGSFAQAASGKIIRSYAFLGRIFQINGDRTSAKTYLTDGATAGDPVAMWLLYDMLKNETPSKADEWLKKANQKGDISQTEAFAKRMLGEI